MASRKRRTLRSAPRAGGADPPCRSWRTSRSRIVLSQTCRRTWPPSAVRVRRLAAGRPGPLSPGQRRHGLADDAGRTGALANQQADSERRRPGRIAHPTPRSRRHHGQPARSPRRSTPAGPSRSPGPAGYIPIQIQTAYGLSNDGGYNNNISFAGIKGDGAGQTIGIFEEGYNPAFVSTSDPNYSTSALATFDQTFGLPDPPSLDVRRP